MLRRLFRRSRRPSPDDVILAVRVIAACLELGDANQERALRAAGFDARQATRFCVFLPMAFARPALEHLGVTEFVPTVSADLVDGGSLSVRLDRQPEYVAALALAREHRRSRCMPHDV